MASFTFDDFDLGSFNNMSNEIQGICKEALYDGAGIIADQVKSEINSIPSECLLNERERDDLSTGLVVSKHQNVDGDWVSYIDFAGYNNFILNGQSKGEPIQLIARAICKGSSMRKGKYNFVGKAFSASKSKAEEAMKNKIEEEIAKLNK